METSLVRFSVLFFCLILGLTLAQDEEPKTVQLDTPTGPIIGLEVMTEHAKKNFPYYSFRGIPYAETPVGKLRFKDTVAKKPWTEPFKATKYGNHCMQLGYADGFTTYVGDEDCLFLNVATPKLNEKRDSKDLLPVMVFIHGGAFVVGESDHYTPDLFLERDVILVAMNYRLGNQALKDQHEALRWVQKNIKSFGGDPDQVTVFGESAGATCTHVLQMSPLSKGLFKGAIVQSGHTLYSPYAALNNLHENNGRRYAKHVGCGKSTMEETVECLQMLPVKNITEVPALSHGAFEPNLELQREYEGKSAFKWFPNVDSYAEHPVMPDHPMNILKRGEQNDVPLIIGTCENEGAMIAPVRAYADSINANFSIHVARAMFNVEAPDVTKEQKIVANTTRHFYVGGGQKIDYDNFQYYLDWFGDMTFRAGTVRSLQIQSKTQKSPVYLYEVTGKPTVTLLQFLAPTSPESKVDYGVVHGDDLYLLFPGFYGIKSLETEEARVTSEKFINLWTNFAKTFNPTPQVDEDYPKWEKFTEDSESYMDIKQDLEIKEGYHTERMYFWKKMFWQDFEEELAQGGRCDAERENCKAKVKKGGSFLPQLFSLFT